MNLMFRLYVKKKGHEGPKKIHYSESGKKLNILRSIPTNNNECHITDINICIHKKIFGDNTTEHAYIQDIIINVNSSYDISYYEVISLASPLQM